MTNVAGIEQDLTEHGLAFLTRSISSLGDEDSSRAPLFAVVDIAVAIEALLKARLAREHWSLVLADPNRSSAAEFGAGQAKTVTPTQAISRLKNIVGITFPGSTETDISKAVNMRNRTMHFTVPEDDDLQAVWSVYGIALNAVLAVLRSEFRNGVSPKTRGQVDEVIVALVDEALEITEVVGDRLVAISTDLKSADACLECPSCRQSTLTFSEQSEQAICAFCLWQPTTSKLAAEEYTHTVLGMTNYDVFTYEDGTPVWLCWNCGSQAAVQVGPNNYIRINAKSGNVSASSAFYACFECASTGDSAKISACYLCMELYPDVDGSPCPSCLADWINQHD